jgi:hypothetical protein
MQKYSVYPIDFVCFFAMGEIMRWAAWFLPLNLSFWVVRSEPPFVICAEYPITLTCPRIPKLISPVKLHLELQFCHEGAKTRRDNMYFNLGVLASLWLNE